MPNEEIDHIIDGICQEFDSLSDAFDFPEVTYPEDVPRNRDAFPEDEDTHSPLDSGTGGTFRPAGNFGCSVNMYPATSRGVCRPEFLLVLPSDPLRKNGWVTPLERQRRTILYFQNALRALHRWASNCGGNDVFLLVEQWPVTPGLTESPLWASTLATHGIHPADWQANGGNAQLRLNGLLRRIKRQQSLTPPDLDGLVDIIDDLKRYGSPRWWHRPHRERLVDSINAAPIPIGLRKQLLAAVHYNLHVLIDPSLSFHENLQAFREYHPEVNFYIRLAAMPRQKPVRFCCLSGQRWPRG